jgi:putative GTP pyrophosphokinase
MCVVWVEGRDYVNNMKPSGYRGYHCIIRYSSVTPLGIGSVLVEIQLRTPAMDQWAKAEHSLRYKYNHEIPRHILTELNKSADAAYAQDVKMNIIRKEILAAEEELKNHHEY